MITIGDTIIFLEGQLAELERKKSAFKLAINLLKAEQMRSVWLSPPPQEAER